MKILWKIQYFEDELFVEIAISLALNYCGFQKKTTSRKLNSLKIEKVILEMALE